MAYPHPCVSENLLLSFSMNSTSVRSPGTVSGLLAEKGGLVNFFGLHSIFTILEPSGKGLPLPGTPSLYALIITGFARMSLITFWASVRLGPTACQPSLSLELREREPIRHFQCVLVLRGNGPATHDAGRGDVATDGVCGRTGGCRCFSTADASLELLLLVRAHAVRPHPTKLGSTPTFSHRHVCPATDATTGSCLAM